MAKRELMTPRGDTRFIRRDERGRFTSNQVEVGSSIGSDRRRQAKAVVAKGQGDRGDQPPALGQRQPRNDAGPRVRPGDYASGWAATSSPCSRPSVCGSFVAHDPMIDGWRRVRVKRHAKAGFAGITVTRRPGQAANSSLGSPIRIGLFTGSLLHSNHPPS